MNNRISSSQEIKLWKNQTVSKKTLFLYDKMTNKETIFKG